MNLRSLEIVAIVVQQGLWWITYRARGQRSGILSEAGIPSAAGAGWLYPILACADEEVRIKDERIEALLEKVR